MAVEAGSGTSLTSTLVRRAGYLGLAGGPFLAAAYLTHPSTAPPATVASGLWIWIHVGFMLSLLCGVFLLFALTARYLADGGRMLGFAFSSISVISLIFVFGLDYSEVFIFPTLAVEFPAVVTKYGDGTSMPSVAFAFPLTGLLFLIGFVGIGWEWMRTKSITPFTGYLTVAGTIVFGAGLSGVFPMIVVRVGSVIFGAALMALGRDLLRVR